MFEDKPIKLYPPFDLDILALADSNSFTLEFAVLHGSQAVPNATHEWEILHAESFRTIQQVGKIEVDDVVAGDDV
jgi:hypothetical protein